MNKFHSAFLVILGNFNARSKSWCSDDQITTYEGSQTESLTTTHSLHQLLSDPAQLLSSFS